MCTFFQVGDEVVTQGLAKDLEAFYNKSDSSGDRTKALELLSSLRIGGERQQEQYPRPHTAMPTVGGKFRGQGHADDGSIVEDPNFHKKIRRAPLKLKDIPLKSGLIQIFHLKGGQCTPLFPPFGSAYIFL